MLLLMGFWIPYLTRSFVIKFKEISDQLQQLFSPKVICVFWITEVPLAKKPFPFDELDYYVDGLLTKHLTNFKEVSDNSNNLDRKCLIATTSFSHPFFIVHINLQTKITEESISEIASTIRKVGAKEYDHVVVIQTKPSQLSGLIKKCFHDQQLEFFNIEL